MACQPEERFHEVPTQKIPSIPVKVQRHSRRGKLIRVTEENGVTKIYRSIRQASQHYKVCECTLGKRLRKTGSIQYKEKKLLFELVDRTPASSTHLPSLEEATKLMTHFLRRLQTPEVLEERLSPVPQTSPVPENVSPVPSQIPDLLYIPMIPLRS